MILQVLFKNLNVDMKEVKPSKLLEGLEREIDGNPDFSNKEAVFSQSPSPAPSATTESAQSVAVPSLPQQLDIPPELPVVAQPALSTSLSSSVIPQVRPSYSSVNALFVHCLHQSMQMFVRHMEYLIHQINTQIQNDLFLARHSCY